MAEIISDYDDECDVLYVTLGQAERSDLSFEDQTGLIWRQTAEGAWNGVTIPDLKFFWGGREAELLSLISARLPMKSIPGLVLA